jgi:hypothetical protein
MKKTIFGLLCVFIINNDITYAVAPEMLAMPQICPSGGSREAIACKIKEMFPEEPDVMLAIALSESGLNNNAMNWNCRYTKVDEFGATSTYSTSCKKGDRANAFSTDHGVFQINNATEYEKTLEGNFKAARAKYDTKLNKRHWSDYKNGKYLKYLPEAKTML